MGTFSGIIRLRRDNDYNYNRIKDTFVPANGEVCLVDTARNGLQAKIGDGVTKFGELEYTNTAIYNAIDAVVVRGYYNEGKFYKDSAYSELLTPSITSIYINVSENKIYTYNGNAYEAIEEKISNASDTTAGVMKLYGEMGQNTDGTMTQKAITDELNEKIEIQVDEEAEMVSFGNW